MFGKTVSNGGLALVRLLADFMRTSFAHPSRSSLLRSRHAQPFRLDRGGKVFKQTAPVIKLPPRRPRTTTRSARAPQQLDGLFLDEAGLHNKGRSMGSAMAVRIESKAEVLMRSSATQISAASHPGPWKAAGLRVTALDDSLASMDELASRASRSSAPSARCVEMSSRSVAAIRRTR